MATPKSVAFHTLGCKLNFTETSSIRRQFEDAGFLVSPFDQMADIYVLNTCSVTDFADRKCRKAVRKVHDINPNASVIVIGCYAQLKPTEIARIPGVDLVLGASEKFNILKYVELLTSTGDKGMVFAGDISAADQFISSFSYGDRTRSFLKVQDGCDYKCSFCTIPMARGKSRSNTIPEVLKNVRALAANGAKEIVLTGINLGDYKTKRQPDDEEVHFLELIKVLEQETTVPRFRISSIEPNLCHDEIIDFVSTSARFMPHFHMPLQSGSDKILASMRRRYKSSLYRDRVMYIKSKIPHACIGVDVIVGFPGERKQDFMRTYQFLNDLPVSYFHVFTYSERVNTLAASLDFPVSMDERRKRNKMLSILSEKKKRNFYATFAGQTRNVLFEKSKSNDTMSGFTDNYLKVELPLEASLINTINPVLLDELLPKGVFRSKVIPAAMK